MNTVNASIKSIHIYPIKGMGGIDVDSARVLERGLEYDRRWMLVDEKGNFITQRTDARLALFGCKLTQFLEVAYNGEIIKIDKEEYSEVKMQTTVWESEVVAYEVSLEVSDWFATRIGFPCHLVRMVDEFDRYKELIKGPVRTKVSFADGYPYLIIGSASLTGLSKQVGDVVPSNRFRANIVLDTIVPHEEDSWDTFELGTAKFEVIKPCARCNVVNIDQSNGLVHKEPLKTLSKYRKVGNRVNFGANTICLEEGRINVGDKIKVLI